MNIINLIKKRHSTRKFTQEKVNRKTLLKIIESARYAPSGKNRQPWYFYVCSNEIKNTISKLMKNWHHQNINNMTSVLSTSYAIDSTPCLVLVLKQKDETNEKIDLLSIGAAIENMLLTATELNISSLWICATNFIKKDIEKLIDTNLELCCAIAFGYSKQKDNQITKKQLNEILLSYK